jgi:hypothetical protein
MFFSDAIPAKAALQYLTRQELDYHKVQNFGNTITKGGYALEFPDVKNLTDAFPMFSRMLIGGYAFLASTSKDYWAVATLSATHSTCNCAYPLPGWKLHMSSSGRHIGVHPPKTYPGAPPHFMNTKTLHSLLSTLYDRLPNSHLSYIVPPHIGYTPN